MKIKAELSLLCESAAIAAVFRSNGAVIFIAQSCDGYRDTFL